MTLFEPLAPLPLITAKSERAALELRVKELEQRVRELEQIIGLLPQSYFDKSLNLLPQEEKVLKLLMSTEVVTREVAHAALYGDRPAGQRPDLNVLGVYVSKIRKKIAHTGIAIETVWSIGWQTTLEDRKRLKLLVRRYDN